MVLLVTKAFYRSKGRCVGLDGFMCPSSTLQAFTYPAFHNSRQPILPSLVMQLLNEYLIFPSLLLKYLLTSLSNIGLIYLYNLQLTSLFSISPKL